MSFAYSPISTGGAGGGNVVDTLAATLAAGNTTGANNILIQGGVQVKVDTSTTNPRTLTSSDSFTRFTNENVSGTGVYNLPTSPSGLEFNFSMVNATPMKIVPPSGVQIIFGSTITATVTGYIQGSARGSSTTLTGISSSGYIAKDSIGTWTIFD